MPGSTITGTVTRGIGGLASLVISALVILVPALHAEAGDAQLGPVTAILEPLPLPADRAEAWPVTRADAEAAYRALLACVPESAAESPGVNCSGDQNLEALRRFAAALPTYAMEYYAVAQGYGPPRRLVALDGYCPANAQYDFVRNGHQLAPGQTSRPLLTLGGGICVFRSVFDPATGQVVSLSFGGRG